jgi:hypothetical protein
VGSNLRDREYPCGLAGFFLSFCTDRGPLPRFEFVLLTPVWLFARKL